MNPATPRPRIVASLTAVLSGLLVTGSARADLQADVLAAIKAASLSEATVSVSVRDTGSGDDLVDVKAWHAMIPASNFKLLTSGAALQVLGPDFEFTTQLLRDGDRLIIVGDGDPAFGDPELLEIMQIDVDGLLKFWVDAAVAAEIKTVSEVVVDDRVFDRKYVHPGWPIDQLNRSYCAQVAGLNFHLNVVHFFPRPAASARPDLATHIPQLPGLDLRNQGTCDIGPRDRSNAWFARRDGTNRITLYGNVKVAYRKPIEVTVHDVPSLFAALLAERLEAARIDVGSVAAIAPDAPVPTGVLLGPPIRTPISTVVTRCNRDSENLYAEALLKRLAREETGRPGSWEEGRALLRHVVRQRLGARATNTLVADDGSGLSRANRVSAGAMTQWLGSMHRDEKIGAIFVGSLAEPGKTGTLEKRFRNVDLGDAEVRGKSGYINNVSCLSGFVIVSGASPRAFSILINDLERPGSVGRAKMLQENIVRLVAEDLVPVGVTMGSD